MLSVLVQALVLASAGIISVGSITLVILLLISDRGWHNGLSYAMGYTGGYTLIGMTAVLLGYRSSRNDAAEPGLFLPILHLALGTLLLWISLRNWRKPSEAEQKPPRFFDIVDQVTPLKALGFGALISVINFKNLALFLSAQSVIILSELPITEKLVISLLVAIVFCLSVIIPVLIYLLFPRRAKLLLSTIKQTLNRHSRPIGIWIPLIFGLLFITKGITDLL